MTIRDFCRSLFLTLHYYNIYVLHDNLLSDLVSSISTIHAMQQSTSRTNVATITKYKEETFTFGYMNDMRVINESPEQCWGFVFSYVFKSNLDHK